MEFFIKQKATLPLLRMEVVKDGRYDYKKFHESLSNAAITFSMKDANTGISKISCKPANIVLKDGKCDFSCPPEYYVVYKWTEKDTALSGSFIGEFKIDLLDLTGSLIVPIREELVINILPSQIRNQISC